MDRVLTRLWVFADPPEGDLPSADWMAALGEGTLLPQEERRLVAEIRRSPAARSELRDLYPERYRALLEAGEERTAKVLAFPRRRMVLAGVLAAALAATLALVLVPPAPPQDGAIDIVRYAEIVRGPETPPSALQVGERFQVHLELGRAGALDRLRGAEVWAGLFRVDSEGRAALVATTNAPSAGACTFAQHTLACALRAGQRPGLEHLVFVTATRQPDANALRALLDGVNAVPDPAARGEALRGALREAARDQPWRINAHAPLEVQAPR